MFVFEMPKFAPKPMTFVVAVLAVGAGNTMENVLKLKVM